MRLAPVRCNMLVLSRKCNEQIVIGNEIIITVVSIRHGTVRIGIEAPPEISVHRREVLDLIIRSADAKNPQSAAKNLDESSGPSRNSQAEQIDDQGGKT